MFLRKYRLHIIIAFISIFSAKMVISAAPVFFSDCDKETINAVILQLEQEHGAEGDSGKNILKFVDYKPIDFHYLYTCVPLLQSTGVTNAFIDHFKRYVNSYHPSVPTPPPNLFC